MRYLYLDCSHYRYELQTELAQDDRDLCRGSFRPRYSANILYLPWNPPTKPDAGAINTFGVRILKYLNNVSVWWHALGTTSLVIAILAAAPKLQSGKFVFRTFIDGTGVDGGIGWSQRASPAYVAVIGILMAQYTLTGRIAFCSFKTIRFLIYILGFDASAHMTEETHNAARSGPIGIIMSIGVSAILGWFLLLGLLFSIQDYGRTVSSPTGEPVTQIFLDTVGEKGAIVLMVGDAF
jgi:amino acid transporter